MHFPSTDQAVNSEEGVAVMSMLDIIKKGGIVGYLIILLSIVALALIIDYAITIRKARKPPGL